MVRACVERAACVEREERIREVLCMYCMPQLFFSVLLSLGRNVLEYDTDEGSDDEEGEEGDGGSEDEEDQTSDGNDNDDNDNYNNNNKED